MLIFLGLSGLFALELLNTDSIAECLGDKLIDASKCSSNSYTIKKKDEPERVAKSNR